MICTSSCHVDYWVVHGCIRTATEIDDSWVRDAFFLSRYSISIKACGSMISGWTRVTHTQPFNGLFSGTTQVGRYQKKHSPTHTHPDYQTSFINFLHLLRFMASSCSSLFSLHAWQSFSTTSIQVLFGLPFGLEPSTLYSIHTHLFNDPFPGLPRWSGTRKVKPVWILLKQETVSGTGIIWAICKSASPDR